MKVNSRGLRCGVLIALCLSPFCLRAFQVAEQSGEVTVSQSCCGDHICETGSGESRAQLNFSGSAVRLGADSSFQASEDGIAELLKGTVVFDLKQRNHSITVRSDGNLISIRRGSGFCRIDEVESGKSSLLIGALSGRVVVEVDGKARRLRPGQLLAFDAQGNAVASGFNLAKVWETGSLLKGFEEPLPSEAALRREVKRFGALEKRGFVRSYSGAHTEGMLAKRVGTGAEVFVAALPSIASTLNTSGVVSGGNTTGVSVSGSFLMHQVIGLSSDEMSVQFYHAVYHLGPGTDRAETALPPTDLGNGTLGRSVDARIR